MFSRRTSWDRTPTALAELVRQKREYGIEIIDLTASNPTQCDIPQPSDLIVSLLDNVQARTYGPDPRGLFNARVAIAEWYARDGIDVDPASIVLTSGTSEAYSFLFELLCDAGDAVLMPRPSYPLAEFLAHAHDVIINPYNLAYDGQWHIDWSSVEKGCSTACRSIIVVHPNNPTGSYVRGEDRKRLTELATSRSVAVIADEVFRTYPRGSVEPAASFAGETDHLTFVLSGLSKVLGLPQLKLSWIVVRGPAIDREEALERLAMLGDLHLSVSMPIQGALPGLLERSAEWAGPIRQRIETNFSSLRARIQPQTGIEVLRCEAGWSAVLRVPSVHTDEQWAVRLLERGGILVHTGSQFDFTRDGYLVISLLVQPTSFEYAVSTMVREITAATGLTQG